MRFDGTRYDLMACNSEFSKLDKEAQNLMDLKVIKIEKADGHPICYELP